MHILQKVLRPIHMSSPLVQLKKRARDAEHAYEEIALTPRHVVVVCEDPPFQKLAELALQEAFARQTIEFDKACKIFKKEYKRPRGTAFYATPGVGGYTYGGVQDVAHDIDQHPAVLDLLRHANYYAGTDKFCGVLLNFYRSGNDCILKHADRDVCREEFVGVLSISLGATRELRFVRNEDTKCQIEVSKPHGAVLAMCGSGFQDELKHEMPRLTNIQQQAVGVGDARLYFQFVDKGCVEIPTGPWHASFTFRRHSKSVKKKRRA